MKQVREHTSKKPAWRHMMMAACLSGFLAVSFPAPARADIVSSLSDVASLVANWASEHADFLLDALQWVWQKTETAIQAAVPIATKNVAANIDTSLNQGQADAELRSAQTAAAGDAAGSVLVPTQTQLCALTHAGQEASVSKAVTNQVVAKLTTMSAARGAGMQVDTTGTAYTASEVNDLCKMGLLDTSPNGRYGLLPQTLGCTKLTGADVRYVDADIRMSSVIGKLQFPLPDAAHVKTKTDGRVSFIGATTTETAPGLGSEMDYAAAYKFCEHLQPELTTPTHNTATPTPNDIISMGSHTKATAMRSSASEECFRAIAYRTSCPDTTIASLTSGGGASCHETQKQLCARLTSTHTQGGLELSMKGDNPIYAAALANCDTEGLSPAMYDAIMAYRCHDRNYAFKVLPVIVGTGAALERARTFDCPIQETNYRSKMNDEKMRLLLAVKNLLIMRTQQ